MHTFCQTCVGRLRSGSNNGCPVCRQSITSAAKNHLIDDIVDVVVSSLTEEDRTHRLGLIQQRADAGDPNAVLTAPTPVTLPLFITILEEDHTMAMAQYDMQSTKVRRHLQELTGPQHRQFQQTLESLDDDRDAEYEERARRFNERVQHCRTRILLERELVQLFRYTADLCRGLHRRTSALIDSHTELLSGGHQTTTVEQMSRERVLQLSNRLGRYLDLVSMEEEMIRLCEKNVKVTETYCNRCEESARLCQELHIENQRLNQLRDEREARQEPSAQQQQREPVEPESPRPPTSAVNPPSIPRAVRPVHFSRRQASSPGISCFRSIILLKVLVFIFMAL